MDSKTPSGIFSSDFELSKFSRAFTLLLEASQYAEATNAGLWEFAVEIHHLQKLGLSCSDLRYLLVNGLIEHAAEDSNNQCRQRRFKTIGVPSLPTNACFVLTELGITTIRSSKMVYARLPMRLRQTTTPEHNDHSAKPEWDMQNRILCYDGNVVKRFKLQARNQETVLAAFQEESWPLRLLDPLPPSLESDSKRRLADTIKHLNRKQETELVHFRGDGTGTGVLWEQRIANASGTTPND